MLLRSMFKYVFLIFTILQCFFLFLKNFLADIYPFMGPLIPLFWDFWWRILWVSRPEWVLPYSLFFQRQMYIPQDPHLVLHIANLLTVSIVGHWSGSYLAQGYYCVAAMSLEPAIIRSRVLHTNHSATHPIHNFIMFFFCFLALWILFFAIYTYYYFLRTGYLNLRM